MRDSQYKNVVEEAVQFVEIKLFDKLSPKAVARHVGFSEFHFHRIFFASTGESITDYIRRRRLVEAASRLIGSSETLLELSALCRFDSQEAFTRAFKRQFGTTPGNFRREAKEGHSRRLKDKLKDKRNRKISFEPDSEIRGELLMKPKIVTREAELAVGMGGSFVPKSTGEIHTLWTKFIPRSKEIPNVKNDQTLGICCSSHPKIPKDSNECIVYIAAMPVSSLDPKALPKGMVSCELAAGRYAVFTHSGHLRDLPETVNYIWGTWVPSAEYQFRDEPDFELYDERFNPETMQGEFDIYVPIV